MTVLCGIKQQIEYSFYVSISTFRFTPCQLDLILQVLQSTQVNEPWLHGEGNELVLIWTFWQTFCKINCKSGCNIQCGNIGTTNIRAHRSRTIANDNYWLITYGVWKSLPHLFKSYILVIPVLRTVLIKDFMWKVNCRVNLCFTLFQLTQEFTPTSFIMPQECILIVQVCLRRNLLIVNLVPITRTHLDFSHVNLRTQLRQHLTILLIIYTQRCNETTSQCLSLFR